MSIVSIHAFEDANGTKWPSGTAVEYKGHVPGGDILAILPNGSRCVVPAAAFPL